MRVIHAIRSDGFAGVERHVARLASSQATQGDEVHVIGGHPVKMAQALAGSGVRYSTGGNLRQLVRRIWRLVGDADIAHVHMTAAEVAVALVSLARRSMPPMVTTRHFPLQRGRGRGARLAAGLAASRLRSQIAISQFVAQHIEGPSTVVYPGVDVQPNARPAIDREPVVLLVQRLEPEKATSLAVVAFAKTGLAKRGWRLEIVGDGSLRQPLADLAASRGLSDAVCFLGSRDDVPQLMARSAMLIAPCPIEGLGLSVLEAMAAGLPAIACAAGGHVETLPAEGLSVCFPPDDTAAAAAAILRLAGDRELRDQLATAGQRRHRARFTLETQVVRTSEIYCIAMRK